MVEWLQLFVIAPTSFRQPILSLAYEEKLQNNTKRLRLHLADTFTFINVTSCFIICKVSTILEFWANHPSRTYLTYKPSRKFRVRVKKKKVGLEREKDK